MATINNNFRDIFSESRNIFKAHYRHLHNLSLIFLFPLSISLVLSPILSNLFNNFYTTIIPYPYSYTINPQQQHHSLFFHLFYSLFTLIFSNCGVISITYSVFHLFNDKPVNLKSAIRSISTSFFPLLSTTIVSHVIIFFITLFYCLLLVLAIYGVVLLNLITISFSSSSLYFIGFFVALPLLLVLIYLQVNWTLVPVIAVVESCYGLEPLRRSTRLMKGMKGVALSSFFYYGFLQGIVVLNCFLLSKDYKGIADGWFLVVSHWMFVVTQSFFLTVFMVSNIAFNTVLYTSCKANHGELVVVEEEFQKDYDGKAFYVV